MFIRRNGLAGKLPAEPVSLLRKDYAHAAPQRSQCGGEPACAASDYRHIAIQFGGAYEWKRQRQSYRLHEELPPVRSHSYENSGSSGRGMIV
jgi:hypothetical protein